MNWAALRLLFIHEMRMVLRSRRTIVTSLVLPAVLMPIMILGARYVQREQTIRLDQTTFRYAITGPWPDQVRRLIDRYKTAAEFRNFQIEEVQPTDPDRALDDRTLHFYIRTMTVEDADKAAAAATNDEGSGPPDLNTQSLPRIEGVPGLQVVYRGSQQIARLGAERMVDMMRAARRNESYSIMLSRGFPSHPEGILALTATNVATEAQVSGSNLGRFFTVVLVVWLVAAGAIVAMDIIAGERGTRHARNADHDRRGPCGDRNREAFRDLDGRACHHLHADSLCAGLYPSPRDPAASQFRNRSIRTEHPAAFHSVRSVGRGYSRGLADRFGTRKDL